LSGGVRDYCSPLFESAPPEAIEMPSVRQKDRTKIAVAALAVAAICAHPAVPLAQHPDKAGSAVVEETTRLADRIAVPTATGANLPLDVEVRRWRLVKAEGGSTLPVQGFYVANLLSGVIVADIDGSFEPHQAGDFWTVP
jgi:hypothetical protein